MSSFGNIGLLGQTTVPTSPSLAGTWNAGSKSFDLNKIFEQLQSSQTQANQANVQRYNDLLTSISNLSGQVTGAGGTFDQSLGLMEGLGTAGATRIEQGVQQQASANEQNLISRGLGNTTIGVNLDQQARQQGEQQLQALNEGVAAQKAGVLQNKAAAQMNIGSMQQKGIESLNQDAPNMSLYAEMIRQATAQARNTQGGVQPGTAQQQAINQAGIDDYQRRNSIDNTSSAGAFTGLSNPQGSTGNSPAAIGAGGGGTGTMAAAAGAGIGMGGGASGPMQAPQGGAVGGGTAVGGGGAVNPAQAPTGSAQSAQAVAGMSDQQINNWTGVSGMSNAPTAEENSDAWDIIPMGTGSDGQPQFWWRNKTTGNGQMRNTGSRGGGW
jgi:hypothetical protein